VRHNSKVDAWEPLIQRFDEWVLWRFLHTEIMVGMECGGNLLENQ
jgi:hypothetical protein